MTCHNLEKRWRTMWPYSCHVVKKAEHKNTSRLSPPNTPKAIASVSVTLEDPTSSWMKVPDECPRYSLALPKEFFHYQAKETEGSWLNAAKTNFQNPTWGVPDARGHSVSAGDVLHLQILLSPRPCGLKPVLSLCPWGDRSDTASRCRPEEWWAPPFTKNRKATNTVHLQIPLYDNDKGDKETSSHGKEREVGLRSSRTSNTGMVSDSRRYRTL